jgi:hypothetical protein
MVEKGAVPILKEKLFMENERHRDEMRLVKTLIHQEDGFRSINKRLKARWCGLMCMKYVANLLGA